MAETFTGQRVTSTVRGDGRVEIALVEAQVGPPGPDEVVVRVEATPINPSDVGLLLAGADPATATVEHGVTILELPPGRADALAARRDQPLPVGNEGAGTVVAAGANVADLHGRVVACSGGGLWARHRQLPAAGCLVLDPGTDPRDAASAFVNPLTALGLLETVKRDGHRAVVHTAAASNLGQMLLRVCPADGIALVNVVRSDEQVALLRSAGAEHVCNSTAPDFEEQLTDAVAATGATVALDAIGGGPLAGRILHAMETALRAKETTYSTYGSAVRKQLHVYGRLDPGPLEIDLSIGFAWDVHGWLLTPFLTGLDPADRDRLRRRVAAELTTTFASTYGATIGLADILDPATIAGFTRRGTGRKYLIVAD